VIPASFVPLLKVALIVGGLAFYGFVVLLVAACFAFGDEGER
jgi:hypothetical protein